MLAVVVFAVVAAVQVECAPNQLWPAAQKPSAFAPPKKPIFGAKEAPAKVDSALANQHAYEQFINTWLQQASLTLNRPELLKFLKPLAPAAAAAPTPAPEVVPAIGQSVVSSLVEPEVAGALEEVIPLAAAEEAPAEPSLPADALVETQDAAPPAEERPFFQEEAEVGPVPVELRPVPIEPEVLAATPEPEVVLVAAEAEAVPVAVEAEAVPLAVEAETQGIQVGADTSLVAAQPEQLFPLASEAEVVLEPLVTAEALPSLAEQDTSTVLLATEAPPLFPSPRNPSPRSASRSPPQQPGVSAP
nr:fibrous sheath CABYR-binding protein-like isoform X2 [Penaeus vannamei]